MPQTKSDGLTFAEWLRLVNIELVRTCGLDANSLADFPSRDLYDSDATPADAARECLEWNDFPEDLL